MLKVNSLERGGGVWVGPRSLYWVFTSEIQTELLGGGFLGWA